MRNLLIVAATACLVACGGDSNNNPAPAPAPEPEIPTLTFEITATNLTAAQPLSPLAVFIQSGNQPVFTVGSSASAELEELAEGGDNTSLLAALDALASVGDDGPLPPGGSTTLSLDIQVEDTTQLSLSAVTMLVNTNDAFTAVNSIDIASLAAGESMRLRTPSYDSGTEANSEAAGTIPGPADGGEGFNAARDDVNDQVTLHGGVVTVDDGLPGSVLGQQHRWDNPVTSFTITRTQ